MVQLDHTSSGWFDLIEPFLTASLEAIEGVRVLYALVGWGWRELNLINPVPNLHLLYFFGRYKVCRGHYALVQGGLSTANLIEPTSLQRWAEIRSFYTSWGWLDLIDLSSSLIFLRKMYSFSDSEVYIPVQDHWNWVQIGSTGLHILWLHLYKR